MSETSLNKELFPVTPRLQAEQIADALDAFVLSDQAGALLYDYQQPMLEAYAKDVRDGHMRGYIESPTASGKTVMFVKAVEALTHARKADGSPAQVLVVTPTIDLVRQTIGAHPDPDRRKGFAKFAPNLNVSSMFTDTTAEQARNFNDAQVIVTTYQSLHKMATTHEMRQPTDDERYEGMSNLMDGHVKKFGSDPHAVTDRQLSAMQMQIENIDKPIPTGRTMLDRYDVIIFDEAHHLHGPISRQIVDSIPSDVHVCGFTATPDQDESARLSSILPHNYYTYPYRDAIEKGAIAPLAAIAVKTGMSMRPAEGGTYDKYGEYNDEAIDYLIYNTERNTIAEKVITTLVAEGLGVIAPCSAGGGALHARELAHQLQISGTASSAVHGDMSGAQRQRIYDQFERGDIDVLTAVSLLGEGWDSQRAKGVVNVRPTRSLIVSQQRAGRAMRLPGVAVIVDLIDDYDRRNPPVHVADLINDGDIPLGKIYGHVSPEDQKKVDRIIERLSGQVALLQECPADYRRFRKILETYPEIQSGRLIDGGSGSFAPAENISASYTGLNDEIIMKIWELHGQTPETRLGNKNYTLRVTYNASATNLLLRDLPRIPATGTEAYADRSNTIWVTPLNLRLMLSSISDKLTEATIQDMIDATDHASVWTPVCICTEQGKYNKHARTHVAKAYKLTEQFQNEMVQAAKIFKELLGD